MLNFVSRARDAVARRNRYNRLVSEINALSSRDLADFNGDRGDMLRAAREHIYGR